MKRIPEIVIFAYPTRGEALEVANDAIDTLAVAEIRICEKLKPAKAAVAWIAMPESALRAMGVVAGGGGGNLFTPGGGVVETKF
jgi:hypothetical protein